MENLKTNRGSSSETESHPLTNSQSDRLFREVLGILLGASIFVVGLVLDPIVSVFLSARTVEGQIDSSFAYVALTLVLVGLCILFASATAVLRGWSLANSGRERVSVFSTLCGVFSTGRPYSRILLSSAAVYAIFYAFASGMVVFNPSVNFSSVYHVTIPSSAVATCCSSLGQTPSAVVYFTEHFGLFLVPINLFLLFLVAWLVGINASIAVFGLMSRKTGPGVGWLGGLGAFIGLFTSCPSCAGLAIFALFGGAGALSTAFLFGPLQMLLIGLSIPILVAAPLIFARALRKLEQGEPCEVQP